jgi:hypothetical protein
VRIRVSLRPCGRWLINQNQKPLSFVRDQLSRRVLVEAGMPIALKKMSSAEKTTMAHNGRSSVVEKEYDDKSTNPGSYHI